MHVNVTLDNDFYNDWYFGPHLQQAGYTVGIFGKHLNGMNPACPPPGVDRWFANVTTQAPQPQHDVRGYL